jgi:membrane fusion protein (multidrug efflux system)
LDFRHFIETLKEKYYIGTDKLFSFWGPMKNMLPNSLRDYIRTIMSGRTGVVVVTVLALALGGYGVKRIFFPTAKKTDEAVELVQVKVQKAKRQNYTDSYSVMGTIKGAVENELRFEIEGVIARFNYTEGAKVPQGRSICALDPKDSYTKADFARSKYSSEQSTYFSAAQRLKTYEELFKMKAISESKLQEARFETQSAEARMKAALSELELSQSNLAKTNLLAPSDGLLAEILIKAGDFITPQDVVAKFISGGSTNFEVDVPEKDVNKLKIGMKVKLNCDSQPGKEFTGELAEIAPTVKERTRTTTIKVRIDNPQGVLRSGMFGRGTVIMTELSNVLLVPSESIVSLGETTFLVPLVKPDANIPGEGTIEMRTVKTGTKLTKMTVIDSGINPDEMVVIETQGKLSDGLRVKFIESVADKLENQPQ